MGTTTNLFFNNYESQSEQLLMRDLVVEAIKRYGIDVYYMPRHHVNVDKILMEDPLNSFTNAIMIEMYVKNFMGYGGEGDIMSKFGITMADQIQFCVARDRFDEDIGGNFGMTRPNEGDLIYLAMTNSIYEIKFVEHESNFYQTGHLNFFELHCERFNYSSEDFNTGNDLIDVLEPMFTDAVNGSILSAESGLELTSEGGSFFVIESYGDDDIGQNEALEKDSFGYIDFSEKNPFSASNG